MTVIDKKPKYINADELEEKIVKYKIDTDYMRKKGSEKRRIEQEAIIFDILGTLKEMPSANVVEVICCEKCEHRINDKEHLFNNCGLIHRDSHGFPMEKNPDDFCLKGERKETNG